MTAGIKLKMPQRPGWRSCPGSFTIDRMAGYSGTALLDKLGVKPGMNVVVMRAPADYADVVAAMGERAKVGRALNDRVEFIQYFATSEQQLEAVMPNLAAHLVPNGMVWVSWAKRTSPLHTGVDENMVRRIGLAAGLVDVKVAAVSDDWSALKFVYRVADR